jgi:non-heme chloroperoxidase
MQKQPTTRFIMLPTMLPILLWLPVSAAGEDQTAKPLSGFVTTLDGVRIHYLEATPQSGPRKHPAILFIPGWTMPAEIWEKQIPFFARSRRVVAMDPRSQGLSSQTTEGNYPEVRARDIKAVVDQLKLAPVALVGWSMGVADLAAYVEQFALDGIDGLVLVDGGAGEDLEPGRIREFLDFSWRMQTDRRAATARFVRSMYQKPQTEEYYQRIIRAALRTPTDSAVAMLSSMVSVDRRPALAKINRPTLIVAAGSRKRQLQEEMHRRIAGSRLVFFESAGHALFVDEPDRFNALLDEFLQTLER